MGRLQDALNALLGRLPSQRMAVIEAEWATLQMDMSNMLEQIGRWAGREAKRAARETKKLNAENQAPTTRAVPQLYGKAALRARLRTERGVQMALPSISDEPEEEESP